MGHVCPEAALGGPLAAVRDGDRILVDIPGRRLEVELTRAEMERRLRGWRPPERKVGGFLSVYRRIVGPAGRGARLEVRDEV